mgnify:CR=1 FL=1
MIKSPLRYPGGKSRAIPQIANYLPANFSEYREPFVGGGSLFIYLKQAYPKLNIWINDLNQNLFLFWKYSQLELPNLVLGINKLRDEYQNGKDLFEMLTQINVDKLSDLDRAIRFFVLNRITFSGTVESGGYSEGAFQGRFTISSIERLAKIQYLLEGVEITNLDYVELLKKPGKDVFIFLDPPYYSARKSKLYGKKGDLHTSFDHDRFAQLLKECNHPWLITYDDCPETRKNFQFANIYEWELQYGMNNYKQDRAAKGKELFITNYKIHKENTAAISQLTQQLTLDFCV